MVIAWKQDDRGASQHGWIGSYRMHEPIKEDTRVGGGGPRVSFCRFKARRLITLVF